MKKLVLSALALTLSVGAALGPAAPAQAGDPVDQTARWLNKQLDSGLVHNDADAAMEFDDYGLSIDVGFALLELDQKKNAKGVSKAIATNVKSYTTGADFGSSDVYAGPTAKAAAFAQATGKNASSFGGVNLIKRLGKLVAKDKRIAGRLQDKSATDFANVIGQSYATRALSIDGNKRAKSVTAFLLAQQCKSGYFRLSFTEDKTAKDQSCDGGKRKTTSAPDTDATAVAVLSLLDIPKPTKAVKQAVADAVRWLSKHQAKNGSFGGGTTTEAANANSTGLAGWALGSAGACAKAQKAAKWLFKLVVTGVSGENGAVAYDKAALAVASDGIDDSEEDQFRRATAQAAPALPFAIVDGCD